MQGLLSGGFVAAQSDPLTVARSTGEPLDVSSGELAVRVDDAALDRVRWVTGGPPGAPSTTRTLRDSADQAHVVQVVPVALSARTAAAWGVSAGDVLDLSAGANTRRVDSPTSVVVSGTFEPQDPADEVWAAEPRDARHREDPHPAGRHHRPGRGHRPPRELLGGGRRALARPRRRATALAVTRARPHLALHAGRRPAHP